MLFDEDFEFTPSSSSNLSSLFSNEMSLSESNDYNRALIYQPPKQPQQQNKEQNNSTVIIAKFVHSWKLVDNKYAANGKSGLAIIGSSTQTELILYKEQKNVVLRIQLTNNGNFAVNSKENNFLTFYDGNKVNWMVRFGSNEDLNDFLDKLKTYNVEIISCEVVEQTKVDKNVENKSIDSSDDQDNKVKSDILNRIAKMGQSMLPKSEAVPDEIEEESNELVEASTARIVPMPRQNIPNNLIINQPTNFPPFDALNVLCSENRTQNTEIRMNLSQINEKLNSIMNVVNNSKSNVDESEVSKLKSRIKVLELQNENLTRALSEAEKKVSDAKQEERNESEIEQLKEEIFVMQQEQLMNVKRFEEKIETDTKIIADLSETIEMQLIEIKKLKEEVVSREQQVGQVEEIMQLHGKIEELEAKLSSQVVNEENVRKLDENVLKEAMEEMFGNILDKFQTDQTYSPSQIQTVLAKNIKFTTKKLIQNLAEKH